MSLEDLEYNPQKMINKCKFLISRIKPHNKKECSSLLNQFKDTDFDEKDEIDELMQNAYKAWEPIQKLLEEISKKNLS